MQNQIRWAAAALAVASATPTVAATTEPAVIVTATRLSEQ